MEQQNLPLTWDDFMKVEMRTGTIVEAQIFKEAKKPAYKMLIDFGPLGMKKSSAQLTQLYQPEDLIGKQIVAVLNFPPRQIANIQSECLVLGAVGPNHEVTLLTPERKTENGQRIA